jgi:hypothetical protein
MPEMLKKLNIFVTFLWHFCEKLNIYSSFIWKSWHFSNICLAPFLKHSFIFWTFRK